MKGRGLLNELSLNIVAIYGVSCCFLFGRHSVDLFLDFIQIFRRIMIILAQNKVGVKTCDFTLY